MTELPLSTYLVHTPDGPKVYVTVDCLSHERVFERGLPPEIIVGVLRGPVESVEAITPAVFARNGVFVDFMHGVIAGRGPELPGLVAAARRQGDGWVYIIDQRTPTPQGAVPPEDIVGAFEVRGGQVVPGSYRPSPKHMILSSRGFFQLGELQPYLLAELAALAEPGTASDRGDT
jgi:hypothetical protein